MDPATCQYYLCLLASKKIPLPLISKLLGEFGSAKAIRESPRSMLQGLGFDPSQCDLLQGSFGNMGNRRGIRLALEWAEKEGNHLICYESNHYPVLLREIDAAPPILFVKGSLTVLAETHFAVVGSRRATHYGKRNAYFMAQELSKAGLQVCSGLADGIDSKAHEGAMDVERKTLAVIGTGIDRVYPSRNEKLAARIVENGALLSEFAIGTPPYPANFPRRNRIISGLASGTLVVEANIKSGSLITARLAMEQNRDVFAIPGPIASPQSRGCHYLIKQGAKLVEQPADILEEYAAKQFLGCNKQSSTERRLAKPIKPVDTLTLDAIDHQGCLFQSILDECGLGIQELNAQLIYLEAAGLIRHEGGRYFKVE